MKPEAKIVKSIADYLRSLPCCWHFKVHGSAFQTPGVPDLVGCYRGRFFGMEVKVTGNTTTPIQDHVIGKIRDAGAYVAVVRSLVEAQDLIAEIEEDIQQRR